MYSFYGGRPGNSFTIITTYPTVQEMIDRFSEGPDYTKVHFDQHVMINTNNKNDPDNGKIYRRGYNYNDADGGASYIGQIVGPAGPAPNLELKGFNEVEETYQNSASDITSEKIYKNGEFSLESSNNNLIPGYYIDNKGTKHYNDSIQWNCLSIRTSDGETTDAYIGFKFPYLVMDFEVQSIESNQPIAIEENQDSKAHPFYSKWKLKIPKGEKGDSFTDLTVKKYDGSSINGLPPDITNNDYIITYEANGNETYLAKYNMIKNITQNENGKITISYTTGEEDIINIRQIKSTEINSETGQLTITYSDGNTQTKTLTNWINNIEFDKKTSSIKLTYANSVGVKEQDFPINWIKSAEIKTDENDKKQYLYLNWANPVDKNSNLTETKIQGFKWITKIELLEEGRISVTYNDGTSEKINSDNPISWVTKINTDTSGRLQCVTNTGNTYTISLKNGLKWIYNIENDEENGYINFYFNVNNIKVKDGVEVEQIDKLADPISIPFKQISSISLENNGNINANYNYQNNSITENIGNIKWITDLEFDENDGDLKVTWNNNENPNPKTIGNINYVTDLYIDRENNDKITLQYLHGDDKVLDARFPVELIQNEGIVSDLTWNGVGYIQENDSNYYLKFSLPTTKFIPQSIVRITDLDDFRVVIKTSQDNISFGETVDITSFSINKSLIGLEASIQILTNSNQQEVLDQLFQGVLVDIFISGMELSFSDE